MRRLIALTLVLATLGCSDRRDSDAGNDAPSAKPITGPDPLVLRVARAGGPARVYDYAPGDSLVWSSTSRVPSLARVMAFDEEAGHVVFATEGGQAGRLDFRLGTVSVPARPKLTELASADGASIFGIADGTVTRLTPVGTWTLKPPVPARAVYPQRDGNLLIAGTRGRDVVLWKVRPPDDRLADSVVLDDLTRGTTAIANDRIYFADSARLVGVQIRGMDVAPPIELEGRARAIVPTPSGDRLFVVLDSSTSLAVVERYTDRVRELELPGVPTALRMDPLGRYLLVRPERGDSAWVVAIGTDRAIGSVRTRWRADLPAVSHDGGIALVRGDDVVFVDGETLRPRRTVAGGAKDFWHFFLWSGFRPRAAELDQPVEFQQAPQDSAIWGIPIDSGTPPADTVAAARPAEPSPAPAPTPLPAGWMVQFGSLLDEGKARDLAREIEVGGQRAKVITSSRTGTTLYRVLLGPYPSRAEAERVGRESRRDFWVFEGGP